MKKRYLALAVLLLLSGFAVAQIMPYGTNGTPSPIEQTPIVGGGDYFVAGPVMVVDSRGRLRRPIEGLHRITKSTGKVETYVVVVTAAGKHVGRWLPTEEVPLSQ